MYQMIEISSEQKTELSENLERALYYAGRAMSNVEDMCCDDRMGRRYGMRDDEYRQDEGEMYGRMGERRGVKGTGRYGMGRRYGNRDPYYD